MTMPIMAAHARNWCRWINLTLALLCFVFVTPTVNGVPLKWGVNDGNWKTIKLEPPKGDRDLTLDLTGLSTRLVDNVQLKLDGHTREPLYPPPASSNSTAVWKVRSADWQYQRLSWSGSGSAAAVGVTSLDVLPAVACVAHSVSGPTMAVWTAWAVLGAG
ncbi:hypothetical protein FJT64_024247 [Amphibalanus amphitrite]|uniref:Uncharacterized protein n=1 Tax=Amphibalanus amphitrite TaxID=1232801 RepID=A0A6A4W7U3_AMPAM|nr:hypothetical protein FJT64_024247 [Amphibalanus amphitrite]